MTYKQIKWMILFIPTLTVGLWEYVRHQFLLSYISMDLGNWLTPVLVYLVSVTLLNRLFSMLEKMQRELQAERAAKAAFEAREQLAKELHDGIAQTLFLLSVKVDKLEHVTEPTKQNQELYKIRKTIHEVNRYVRQAIANLRYSTSQEQHVEHEEALVNNIRQITEEVLIPIHIEWTLPDNLFNSKERIELLACIREAVINIQKHAQATKGWIIAEGSGHSDWKVEIKDNGRGFRNDPSSLQESYGLTIMKDRAEEMGWGLRILTDNADNAHTIIELHKIGEGKGI